MCMASRISLILLATFNLINIQHKTNYRLKLLLYLPMACYMLI